MKRFCPTEDLNHLRSSYGVVRHFHSHLDDARAKNVLGSRADAIIGDAIHCIIVGWDEPVDELLTIADSWLHVAISEQEKSRNYEEYLTEGRRLHLLGMCRFLIRGNDEDDLFRQAGKLYAQYYVDEGNISKRSVELSAIWLFMAKLYDELIELCRKSDIDPEMCMKSNPSEGVVVCAMSQQRRYGFMQEESVKSAVDRMLIMNAEREWLLKGHYYRIASWMKIMASGKGMYGPREIVRRCYDYMPGVTRPAVQ